MRKSISVWYSFGDNRVHMVAIKDGRITSSGCLSAEEHEQIKRGVVEDADRGKCVVRLFTPVNSLGWTAEYV